MEPIVEEGPPLLRAETLRYALVRSVLTGVLTTAAGTTIQLATMPFGMEWQFILRQLLAGLAFGSLAAPVALCELHGRRTGRRALAALSAWALTAVAAVGVFVSVEYAAGMLEERTVTAGVDRVLSTGSDLAGDLPMLVVTIVLNCALYALLLLLRLWGTSLGKQLLIFVPVDVVVEANLYLAWLLLVHEVARGDAIQTVALNTIGTSSGATALVFAWWLTDKAQLKWWGGLEEWGDEPAA